MSVVQLETLLKCCESRKHKHYHAAAWYKSVNTSFTAGINVLNTLSITSLVISLSTLPAIVVLSLSCSSISALLSAISSVCTWHEKELRHFTSFNQYSDLARDISLVITRNNLTKEKIQHLMSNFNDRISLIEDSSLYVSDDN